MTADLLGIPAEALAIGGGTLAVVAAGAALLRRGRGNLRIDTEEAAMASAAALPGFAPLTAVIGHDGLAALVGGNGDRIALIRAGRSGPAAREIGWSAVRATPDGIVVEAGEQRPAGSRSGSRDGVPIMGIDALDVRRLARAASPEAIAIAEGLAPLPDISRVVPRSA